MPTDLQSRLCEALEALRSAREALNSAASPLERRAAQTRIDAVLAREGRRFFGAEAAPTRMWR